MSAVTIEQYYKLASLPELSDPDYQKYFSNAREFHSNSNILAKNNLPAPQDRAVGVEVEIEHANGVALPSPKNTFWRVDQDGSLRNNGRELISLALAGENLPYALGELELIFNKYKNIQNTHRCSIHVHVNVRDMTVEQVQLLVITYLILEELFFLCADEYRAECNFCAHLNTLLFNKEDIISRGFHGEAVKYFALNFGTISHYGTVEFRHMEGTKDIIKIYSWIELCKKFVQYFKTVDVPFHTSLIMGLNSNSAYDQFVDRIFGYNPWPSIQFQGIMESGVTRAKRMLQ